MTHNPLAPIDAIDELVARSKDHRELRAFHAFHRAHPEVLDFLVAEIRLRILRGFTAFSFHSLWEYARWKLEMESGPGDTYLLNDHAVPFYARAITVLHPEFNGRAELRKSRADEVFGTEAEPHKGKHPTGYARRLRWADGTTLGAGWRPTLPHIIQDTGIRRADIHAASPAKREPKLVAAARLILSERDNLADSAPRHKLFRLESLAGELRGIEDSL
jgi:hypothetical protein